MNGVGGPESNLRSHCCVKKRQMIKRPLRTKCKLQVSGRVFAELCDFPLKRLISTEVCAKKKKRKKTL